MSERDEPRGEADASPLTGSVASSGHVLRVQGATVVLGSEVRPIQDDTS